MVPGSERAADNVVSTELFPSSAQASGLLPRYYTVTTSLLPRYFLVAAGFHHPTVSSDSQGYVSIQLVAAPRNVAAADVFQMEIRRWMVFYPAAYLRKYFTATVRSFGHVAMIVSGLPVTGWARLRASEWSAGRAISGRSV